MEGGKWLRTIPVRVRIPPAAPFNIATTLNRRGTWTRVRVIHQPRCGSPRYGSMAPIDT